MYISFRGIVTENPRVVNPASKRTDWIVKYSVIRNDFEDFCTQDIECTAFGRNAQKALKNFRVSTPVSIYGKFKVQAYKGVDGVMVFKKIGCIVIIQDMDKN